MKSFFRLFFWITLLTFNFSFAQENFKVTVKIINKNTNLPIKNADVQVNGRSFYFSLTKDYYIVTAKVNDELIVEHPDFETVYYTIKDNEEIKILVEDFESKREVKRKKTSSFSKRKISKPDFYHQYLDSAKRYKKKDIDKSLSFIEKTLHEELTQTRRASSFEVLADIYLHWKQYDLAIENYEASLKERNKTSVRLNLAKAYYLNKEYKKSKQAYEKSLNSKTDNYKKLTAYEGLGNVYAKTKNYNKSKKNYNNALIIAQKNDISPKITDLNSKIAEVLAKEGKNLEADKRFQNSLELANKENIKRSLKEQHKVADFYNNSRRYDDEIQLRKESLKNAKDIIIEDKESLVDSITSQKINYKIGNAYVQKEDYQEAIPYLEKSINDANKKEDLVVAQIATKKLSEVYSTVGDYTKALASYREYVDLVDKLYSKKQQEIYQIKRFSKRITENKNRISSLEKDKELSDNKIELAYKDQELTQESNKRQKTIIYSLLVVMVLFGLLGYFMYRNIKQQKLANNLLALKSMRSQMNPHFIFNALNSVNSFIAVNDERSANRYLSEFSALMRSVLENSDEDFIPLTKEIELLELYVKLEHNRFKDKFEYSITIDEQIQLANFSIPPMLLQPYIENAIWHGLRYKKEKGNLAISMNQQTNDAIIITIEDNGVGRKKSIEMKTKNQLKQKSKGMSTIKNRIAILNNMYKDKVAVTIKDALTDGTGTKVLLTLKRNQL